MKLPHFSGLLALPLLLTGGIAAACPPSADATTSEVLIAQAEIDAWQQILTAYVTDDGGFRYEALVNNTEHVALLDGHLATIAGADLGSMEGDAKLAFLMNAYNAYTVRSVVELWPVSGVLEEDGFFDGREHSVGGTSMSLNTLENDHIRAAFGEPRIHFLVNCASTGCPWLSGTLITPENLESMLSSASASFVQRTTIVDRDAGSVQVSQIFDWFSADFEAGGGVRAFLAAQFEGDDATFMADESTSIGFFDYDWSTNAR